MYLADFYKKKPPHRSGIDHATRNIMIPRGIRIAAVMAKRITKNGPRARLSSHTISFTIRDKTILNTILIPKYARQALSITLLEALSPIW